MPENSHSVKIIIGLAIKFYFQIEFKFCHGHRSREGGSFLVMLSEVQSLCEKEGK